MAVLELKQTDDQPNAIFSDSKESHNHKDYSETNNNLVSNWLKGTVGFMNNYVW